MKANLKDGQPCTHKGCLSHLTHPCEGCGRVGGIQIDALQTRLQEIRDRVNKATKGPWVNSSERNSVMVSGPTGYSDEYGPREGELEMWDVDDAEFIAHARQDIPHLLDAIERLENFIEKVLNQDVDIVNIASSLQQTQAREQVLREALEAISENVMIEALLLEVTYVEESPAMTAVEHLYDVVKMAKKVLEQDKKPTTIIPPDISSNTAFTTLVNKFNKVI